MFEEDIKEDLLRFSNTCLYIAEKGIDQNIVSCNRIILLHGPPGKVHRVLFTEYVHIKINVSQNWPNAPAV